MKTLKIKSAVLMVIMLMAVGCVHLPIIINEEENPDSEAVAELTKLLDGISYPGEYKFGFFDCSNESALLYDYLSQKGYKCKIMVGWKPLWRWHSWLIAEKNGKKFWIESTKKEIVCTHSFAEYLIVYAGSLEIIKKISIITGSSREWKY